MSNKNFPEKYLEYDKKWNADLLLELYRNDYEGLYRINDTLENHPYYILYELLDELEYLKKYFDNSDFESLKQRSKEINELIISFADYMINNHN